MTCWNLVAKLPGALATGVMLVVGVVLLVVAMLAAAGRWPLGAWAAIMTREQYLRYAGGLGLLILALEAIRWSVPGPLGVWLYLALAAAVTALGVRAILLIRRAGRGGRDDRLI